MTIDYLESNQISKMGKNTKSKEDSVYQVAFPKYAMLKMLYSARDLIYSTIRK